MMSMLVSRLKLVRSSAVSACTALALASVVLAPSGARAIDELPVTDTYFSRFLRDAVVRSQGPGKFRLLYLHGADAKAAGIGGEVPMGVEAFGKEGKPIVAEPPWLAHDIALLMYRLEGTGAEGEGFTGSVSASYGLAARYLPFVGSIHVGGNASYASTPSTTEPGETEKSSSVAPYLYLDSRAYDPRANDRQKLRAVWSAYAQPTKDYDGLQKAQATLGLTYQLAELGAWYEFTKAGPVETSEFSLYGFAPLDELGLSGARFRAGNVSTNGTFGNDAEDDKQLFGVLEVGYGFYGGLSYRDDVGLGWKFGVDYTMPPEVAGFPFGAQLYYCRDYINDTVLGQYVDESLWVIGLAIR